MVSSLAASRRLTGGRPAPPYGGRRRGSWVPRLVSSLAGNPLQRQIDVQLVPSLLEGPPKVAWDDDDALGTSLRPKVHQSVSPESKRRAIRSSASRTRRSRQRSPWPQFGNRYGLQAASSHSAGSWSTSACPRCRSLASVEFTKPCAALAVPVDGSAPRWPRPARPPVRSDRGRRRVRGRSDWRVGGAPRPRRCPSAGPRPRPHE